MLRQIKDRSLCVSEGGIAIMSQANVNLYITVSALAMSSAKIFVILFAVFK